MRDDPELDNDSHPFSQLAVQHAVDMAARAGREALIAAVTQAEEWCALRRVSGECEELRRER